MHWKPTFEDSWTTWNSHVFCLYGMNELLYILQGRTLNIN